jgi:hypothetical protein
MSAKKRARKDNLSFDITTPLMHEIWQKQEGKCAKTGVEMGRIGDKWTSPSIDRIDSSRGYEKDNVQWVCWRYNDAKSNMNDDEFVAMCLAVAATYFKELDGKSKL